MPRLTSTVPMRESGRHRTPTHVPQVARIVAIVLIAVCAAAAQQDTPPGTTAWFCPMHPEVTASEAGSRCRKCGMALVPGDPFDTREYSLEVVTVPVAVKAGVPVALYLTVRHPGTNAVITGYEVVHEKRFHLFVLSRELGLFEHIHREQLPDGRWTIRPTTPSPA